MIADVSVTQEYFLLYHYRVCCITWSRILVISKMLAASAGVVLTLLELSVTGVSGQSQPPCHLSMFLEVTDPRNTPADWSCFVSHRLSVVNQRTDERSVTKESQNRYSKAAKDWGWREFVTLTSLFDQDSGFLVQDVVVFSAEVLILKETSTMLELLEYEGDAPSTASGAAGAGNETGRIVNRGTFTWRVENFLAFKEIMETRKIFSKFFQAGGCELRIGAKGYFPQGIIGLAGNLLQNHITVRVPHPVGVIAQIRTPNLFFPHQASEISPTFHLEPRVVHMLCSILEKMHASHRKWH